jgi:hypothetical protein
MEYNVKVNNIDMSNEKVTIFEVEAPIAWWVAVTYSHKEFIVEYDLNNTLENWFTLDSIDRETFVNVPYPLEKQREDLKYPIDPDFIQMCYIPYMEYLRTLGEEGNQMFLTLLPIGTIIKGSVIISNMTAVNCEEELLSNLFVALFENFK